MQYSVQYSVQYFLQYLSYLARQWWQTHRTDELIKLHPLAELQQGNVIVVVVGLEVWMEDDSLHRAVGGQTFVPSIMDTEEHLEDTHWLDWSCWAVSTGLYQSSDIIKKFPPHTLTCSGATGTTLVSLRWDLRTWAAVRTQDSDNKAPEPNQRSSGTRDRSSTLSRTCQGNRPGSAPRPPTILFT